MTELEKKIEEAADNYALLFSVTPLREAKTPFIDGAKSPEAKEYWQQEMYTEEEVKEMIQDYYLDQIDTGVKIHEWFEQNKKKP